MYVYVLRSLKNGKRYIGCSEKDPTVRLKEHNQPFELFHVEDFEDSKLARKRECYLKSGRGRAFLDTLK